jgi:hypothetical protein
MELVSQLTVYSKFRVVLRTSEKAILDKSKYIPDVSLKAA